MSKAPRRVSLFAAALAAVLVAAAGPSFGAPDAQTSLKNADKDVANGDLKAAAIELRNAVRASPDDPKLRLRLANVYLQLNDPVSAEREARAARERMAAEADYLPVLIQSLLRQGKFSAVTDLVQTGNRPPALESQVRYALGVAAAAQRDRVKAKALLRDAVRLDPNAVPPKIALARLLASTKPDEANKLLDDAFAVDPHAVEALQVKGELARAKGDTKAALSDFDAALRINPKDIGTRLSRASLNIAEVKYKAADEDLNQVLKDTPNNFFANYLRALEDAKQRQFAAADRRLDRLSPMFAEYPPGLYLQGATKFALQQYGQAESILARYLSQVPGDVRAARIAATAALRQRAPERAIDLLRPFAAKPNADAATLALLGNAYMAAGKPDLAYPQFEKAAALAPNNPLIETRKAISEIDIGQGKQGLAELEKVFDTQSGATVAGPTLVLAQLRSGQVDMASPVAAALVKREPDNALYQTLSGMVKAAQKNFPGAEAAFRAALTKNPDFTPARNNLAQLYIVNGRADDARKLYQDALVKKSDDEGALLGLAGIAITEKNWSEAVGYINRARTAAPNDAMPGLRLVQLYELQQDWANAKAVAGALNAQFPNDLTVLEAQGRAQIEAGDNNGAIASYKRAVELAPTSVPLVTRYLNLLTAAGYYREASGALTDAIDRNPQDSGLKAALIRVTAQLDGVDAAISRAALYAKDEPNNPLYPMVAGQVYQAAGRWNDAAAVLEKAAADHPDDDTLSVALARVYARTGHFGKAEELLRQRMAAKPNDPTPGSVLGPLYLATGSTANAAKIFNAMLAQRPNDLSAMLGLADVAITEKKWTEAIDQIKRAEAAAPQNPAPGVKLVNLYIARQDWKNASATAAELAAKFPTSVEVLDAQARAQNGLGDIASAIATYERAYGLAPNSSDILTRYVAMLKIAKKYPEAQAVLQAALKRAPQNPAIKADLIRVTADIGGVDAGLAAAHDMAQNEPDNPLFDIVAADLLSRAGRRNEAIGLLERDHAAKPENDQLTTALARLYGSAGRLNKAETLLNTRLSADPGNYAVASTLASLYLENRKYDAAITQYAKIVDTHPADPTALNNLAWLYQQKGDLNKAEALAERAAAAQPNAPQIDDTLGWILVAKGDPSKAVTYLTAANVYDPRDPAIAYHLAVALHRVGRTADAQTMLEKLLSSGASFADKPQAEKLLAEIKRS
jgi:cellulose synthase operon protein C